MNRHITREHKERSFFGGASAPLFVLCLVVSMPCLVIGLLFVNFALLAVVSLGQPAITPILKYLHQNWYR